MPCCRSPAVNGCGSRASHLRRQCVDPLRRQPVRQPLHAPGVVAAQDAVVERLECDAPLRQLLLQILVPVDAELGVVREVRAELQEERPEVVVHGVDVVVVHERRRLHQPRIRRPGPGVVPALRAQHPRLLLRPADVEHALASGPPAQVLLRPLVLALAPAERHHVDPVAFGVALDRVDEPLRDRRHQHRRRPRRASHLAEEVRRTGRRLEQRHVHVQVHPVDALQRQHRVPGQDFGDGSCYFHGSDSGRWAPHRPVYGQRRPRVTNERGFTSQREQRPESDSDSPCAEPHMSRRSEAKPR